MTNLHKLNVLDIDGNKVELSRFEGKVLLMVNVASECGLTPQYTGLQNLQNQYTAQGFNVIGFPCNQFGQQEPGDSTQIKAFCTTHFSVDFPIMSKIDVNGENRHAIYNFLAGENASFPGDITWNFEKFLIGKDGQVLKRFSPKVEPEAQEVLTSIESALSESS